MTSEPQDSVFLVVGYNISHGYSLAFLLSEDMRDEVEWGQVLDVDLDTRVMHIIEGSGYPQFMTAKVTDIIPTRDQAANYQEQVNNFMIENGWTEDEPGDLAESLEKMAAQFDRFPEPGV